MNFLNGIIKELKLHLILFLTSVLVAAASFFIFKQILAMV